MVQGVSAAFSAAYQKVDVRQKLVEVCRRAGWWLLRRCSSPPLQAVDVYAVARDQLGHRPLLDHVLTTSRGLVVSCQQPPIAPDDNIFLSVLRGSLSVCLVVA